MIPGDVSEGSIRKALTGRQGLETAVLKDFLSRVFTPTTSD
jgi:hypothetical protein